MNELERALPNSAEAERAVLGGILLQNSLIAEASAFLVPDQFYVPSHRRIYVAMLALAEQESAIDAILIAEELDKENAKESVGGISFITNLTYGLPHSSSIAHYAKVVRDKALLRQLIKTANKITQDALEGEDSAGEILERAEQDMLSLNIQAQLSAKSTVRNYEQVAGSVMDMFEKWSEGNTVAIPTQIPELDRRLAFGGLSAQDFIVIAARTSFGKTALALQIALNVARTQTPVLIFSLEMSAERLFVRNLSSVTGVAHRDINPWTFAHNTKLSGDILRGVGKLRDLPLQVEDKTYSLNRLLAIAREWRRKTNGKGLLITDYIQLVKNTLDKRSREQEVAGISMELKRLAKELDVPVIGVSQFSREQAKQNRRPELSDLRESGQLEQDVDVALFPYSQDGIKDEPVRAMKLYCPKQRSGSAGWEIDIDFDAEHQWMFTEQMYRGAA